MTKVEDLTGRQFGLLTVLERSDENIDNYAAWRCRCACGNEITVSSKRLKRGNVTDCGCIPKRTARNGTIAEDLTGHVFGKLEVIRRDENRGSRTCWVCRCACGNLHSVTAHDLKSGHVRSCGCASHKSRYQLNLRGHRFGRLVALRPLEKRSPGGSVMWECLCDCGKKVDAASYALISGNTVSCGCRQAEIKQALPTNLHRIDGTTIERLQGMKARTDNKTGIRGISKAGEQKYRAYIGLSGQRYDLGYYKTAEEAAAVRQEVSRQLFDPVIEAYRCWSDYVKTHQEWADEHPLRFTVIRHDKTDFEVQFEGLPDDPS